MQDSTWNQLEQEFRDSPRSRAQGVSILEISAAQQALGLPFSQDYIEFLRRYGGAIVGALRVYGLRLAPAMGAREETVTERTLRLRKEKCPMADQLIMFSMDGGGGQIGMDATGKVWVIYAEGAEPMAADFEGFLRKHCLEMPT